jgi:hypothetical protein
MVNRAGCNDFYIVTKINNIFSCFHLHCFKHYSSFPECALVKFSEYQNNSFNYFASIVIVSNINCRRLFIASFGVNPILLGSVCHYLSTGMLSVKLGQARHLHACLDCIRVPFYCIEVP